MDFYLNIGTLTRAINEYKNKRKLTGEEKDYIVSSVNLFTVSGWSGEGKDKFVETFTEQIKIYEKFEKDLDDMISALEEEKRRALLLKARSEDFVNCIQRSGQGSGFTGQDEGIISLDYSSQGPINNFVNNCTNEDYTRLKRNFNEIESILSELEYTSFGISGDVDTLKTSVNNQTESLTEFNDSYNMYYAGVKDMESNICSMFSQISGINADMFKQSSLISPSGDIDKNELKDVMLKNEDGLTDEDKSALDCLEKILGNEEYNKYKATMLKNPEDLTDDEKKMLESVSNIYSTNDSNLSNDDVKYEKTSYAASAGEEVESIDDDVESEIQIQTTDGAAVTYVGEDPTAEDMTFGEVVSDTMGYMSNAAGDIKQDISNGVEDGISNVESGVSSAYSYLEDRAKESYKAFLPKSGTKAVGISLSGALPGARAEASMQFIVDSNGNWDIQGTMGAGAGTPTAGVSLFRSTTNASSLEDTEGWGRDVGGTFLQGVDENLSDSCTGTTESVAAGTPDLVPEIHADINYTGSGKKGLEFIKNKVEEIF